MEGFFSNSIKWWCGNNANYVLLISCKSYGRLTYPPHIIIAVVYIFISLYVYIFPVPRIVATALNIWENNDIFLF